ncbi:hypothetical protein [Mucilaginibacter arboris]|uniref:Ribbon-helix-helix protein CopG domain-containing protein n=1 Tax=Mucilaginibacter arboris TaxID=2682090 RepID=A0A7K1SRJ7_9SPHI|nr:hypothetical protein [Mucilaginibacter arboris]MVN19923.1 hypothetical protein [Mucilaginibacter arboris]
MKSILLKIDDKLFEETEKHVKKLKISRNSFIKEAIATYAKTLSRKEWEEQVRREVEILKAHDPDKELKQIFQTASLIDMQKYLDDEY